jgi:hypothetical protein
MIHWVTSSDIKVTFIGREGVRPVRAASECSKATSLFQTLECTDINNPFVMVHVYAIQYFILNFKPELTGTHRQPALTSVQTNEQVISARQRFYHMLHHEQFVRANHLAHQSCTE